MKLRELILKNYFKYIHFIKYAVIGVTGVSIDFLVFYLLTEYAGMYYQYANAISVTCGITNNFIWNAIYNFKVKDKIFDSKKVLIKPEIRGKGLLRPKGNWYIWVDKSTQLPVKMSVGFIIGSVDVVLTQINKE